MSLPYYNRFPRDFLEGTAGMRLEVKGAYAIVLDLIFIYDGRLPADPQYIAGNLGCSVRKWNAIFAELLRLGKLTCDHGIISNSRADEVVEKRRSFRDKQSENRSHPNKNNDLQSPNAHQPEPEPESEVVGGDGGAREPDDWPAVENLVRLLVAEVASPWLDPSKSHGLVTTAGRLHAWRQAGASWVHDVLPVVSTLCAKQRAQIATWKFFDQAIGRSIADRRAVLEIPDPDLRSAHERPDAKLAAREANYDRALAGFDLATRQRWKP